MSRLESEFGKLYWPPILLDGLHVPGHTCIECTWLQSFKQLNDYFTDLYGSDWYKQEWAVYWRSQHLQTQYDDRRDAKIARDRRTTSLRNTGNRRDIKTIRDLCAQMYKQDNKITSGQLVRYLKSLDIITTRDTTWRILKKLRKQIA